MEIDTRAAREIASLTVTELLALFLCLCLAALVWGARHFLAGFERMVSALTEAKLAMESQIQVLREIPRLLDQLRLEILNEIRRNRGGG